MENIDNIGTHVKRNKQYVIGKGSKNGLYYYYISGENEEWREFFSLDIRNSNNTYSLQAVKDYIDTYL